MMTIYFAKFRVIFLFLLVGCALSLKAQIKVVYKDAASDTVKFFENRKVMIDQLNLKVDQQKNQLDQLNHSSKSLSKSNDSILHEFSNLKKELNTMVKNQEQLKAKAELPLPEAKPVVVAPTVSRENASVLSISPNALSQKVSSDLLKRIDSLKSFNESFNTRLLVLQDSIKSLRADQMKESTPCNFPSSDHSHTLIYVLIGLLFLAVVVLFLKK